MPDYIDLHIHNDHSDGLQTPRQVVDRALKLKLKAIAITDHDSVSGFCEAAAYAKEKDIEVIAGIELSASTAEINDLHILGYLFRPDDEVLIETLEGFRRFRVERGKKMVERLAQMDIEINYDDVLKAAGGATVGRPHLAEVLVNDGLVNSYSEAFHRYLYLGGPVYLPKASLSPAEAIDLIHKAGGAAIMAHPALTNKDTLIETFKGYGLDGLEIYHPTHDSSSRKKYRKIAQALDLCQTGGSDSHNRKGRHGDMGDEKVPFEYLANLKNKWYTLNKQQE
jgi:predicted metal-dependent phosphoesterase TrpH